MQGAKEVGILHQNWGGGAGDFSRRLQRRLSAKYFASNKRKMAIGKGTGAGKRGHIAEAKVSKNDQS